MFGIKAQREAYESIIGHLKDEIDRLTDTNKQLMDRLMAKTFGEYQAYRDDIVKENTYLPPLPEAGTIVPYEADAHETG